MIKFTRLLLHGVIITFLYTSYLYRLEMDKFIISILLAALSVRRLVAFENQT